MPSHKSDLKITIKTADGRKLSLNCKRLIDSTYLIKVGRTRSKKRPYATLTEIFELCRKWTVNSEKQNKKSEYSQTIITSQHKTLKTKNK